jgi:raffinose/stachyose/melibiose transport system permease protein
MSAISIWAGGAVPARGRGGRWTTRRVGTLVGKAGLAIATFAFVSPVLLSVEMSFRSNTAINVAPLAWPKSLSLSNFTTAWSAGGLGQALLWSAVIAVVSVMWLTVAGQVLAYYIVRRGNRLASVALLYVMAGLAFPAPSRLLPLYELMLSLHLIGNPISVMLFQGATLTPLSVLIYRSFLQRMPIEYEDAAYVDGAGHLQVLRHVVVPMLWPSSVAVASLTGIMIWNDFFTPLLLVGGSTYATVPVKIYTFVGQYTAQWGDIFAGLTLAVIPVIIVFILLQRHLVEGLGAGLKG